MYYLKRFASVACAFALFCSSGSARADFITNGSFETGTFAGWFVPLVGNAGVSSDNGPGIGHAYQGNYYAHFGPTGGTYLEQFFYDPKAGEKVNVTFYLANSNSSGDNLNVSFNGVQLYNSTIRNQGYTEYSFTTTTEYENRIDFVFENDGTFSLDDISVTPANAVATPAPSAAIMVLSSVVFGVGIGLRRRFAAAVPAC